MRWPEIADSELVGLDSRSGRVLSSAALALRFDQRSRWLAERKPSIHWSYGDGRDCGTLSAGLVFTVSETTLATEWKIGHALVPAVGNTTGVVRLWVRQQAYTSGTLRAGLRVRSVPVDDRSARIPGDWLDLGVFSLGSSNGWLSSTFTVPSEVAFAPFEVEVYATTTAAKVSGSSSTSVTAWSLVSEGESFVSVPYYLGEHFRRQSCPPDDVWTLRQIRDLQDRSAEVPCVLAHHSFMPAAAVGANQVARYILPDASHTGDVTVYALCRTTSGSAATLNAALDTSDVTSSAGAGLPTADATLAFSSSTLTWRTVTVTPTVGATNYLVVWVDPSGGDTAELLAVYARQADPTNGAFVNGVPAWRLLPVSARDLAPGAPIVNSTSGVYGTDPVDDAETVQQSWTDRFATLNNAAWWMQTRSSVVAPGDWCRTGTTSTAGYDASSPAFAVKSRLVPRWGASSAFFAARATTDEVALDDDEQLRVLASIDGGALFGPAVARLGVGETYYAQFGDADLALTGAAQDVEFTAGFASVNGVPATGSVPARLSSVAVWERPPADRGNLVHFRGYASGGAIPDNDTVTGLSTTIANASRGFYVGMVRVRVNLSHAAPASVRLTLSDGTTTRELAGYGDLVSDGVLSFSDSYSDDVPPAESLDAFKGSTAAATWTLKAYDNASGTTGSVVAWEIELW